MQMVYVVTIECFYNGGLAIFPENKKVKKNLSVITYRRQPPIPTHSLPHGKEALKTTVI